MTMGKLKASTRPALLLFAGLMLIVMSSCAPQPALEASASPPLRAEIAGKGADEGSTPEPCSMAGSDAFGVSFTYDSCLAEAVVSEVLPGVSPAESSGFTQMVIPEHLVFSFMNSYSDGQALYRQAANLDAGPQIVVFPSDAYKSMNDLAKQQIEGLRRVLQERPVDFGESAPFLPTVNAAQVMQIQPVYLDFANGSGVRYLTQVAQETRPVNNQELFYTFQGLTDSGAFYVAVFFPLSSELLPADASTADDAAFNAGFSTYLDEIVLKLNGLSPADFKPDLSSLDAMVMSLNVEPEGGLLDGPIAEADVGLSPVPAAAAPAGLVYGTADGLWRVAESGEPERLLAVANYRFLLPAPDLLNAAFMDDEGLLWIADLENGGKRQLAEGFTLASLYGWGNARTLLLGVWLPGEAAEGNGTGHLAVLDVESGELKVLDEDHLSIGVPDMVPGGETIAYDISPFYEDAETGGRLYAPARGSQLFALANFSGLASDPPWHLANPTWSPSGRQLAWKWSTEEGLSSIVVFDLFLQTAESLFTWRPKGFGALAPTPAWSPDGAWLAAEIWADNVDESGLWLLAVDGSTARRVSGSGSNPHWLNRRQLIYADCDADQMCSNLIFDLDSENSAELDMPGGTVLLPPPCPAAVDQLS